MSITGTSKKEFDQTIDLGDEEFVESKSGASRDFEHMVKQGFSSISKVEQSSPKEPTPIEETKVEAKADVEAKVESMMKKIEELDLHPTESDLHRIKKAIEGVVLGKKPDDGDESKGDESNDEPEEKENFVLYTAKGKCVSKSYFSIKTKNLLQMAIDNDMALVWGSKLKVPDDLWSLLEDISNYDKVYDVVFVPTGVNTTLFENGSYSSLTKYSLEDNSSSIWGEIMVHIS